MVGRSPDSLAAHFVAELGRRLDRAANPATQQWWTRYLKGDAEFRGVKMASIRKIVGGLIDALDLANTTIDERLDLFDACLAQPATEDKLAGMLLVAEHSLDMLTLDHVGRLAAPLADGRLADWNSVDWYCVKVLGPFVDHTKDLARRSRAIAAWRTATPLWQRRAAAVAFVDLAAREPEPHAGFRDQLFSICEANVADPARWSQTSVGWLLRELSKVVPDRVEGFVNEHAELSTEARKNARKYLG